jgi:hypothetical protein
LGELVLLRPVYVVQDEIAAICGFQKNGASACRSLTPTQLLEPVRFEVEVRALKVVPVQQDAASVGIDARVGGGLNSCGISGRPHDFGPSDRPDVVATAALFRRFGRFDGTLRFLGGFRPQRTVTEEGVGRRCLRLTRFDGVIVGENG